MKKIKITVWKETIPVFDKKGIQTGETEEVDWSLLKALEILINNKKPEEMPRGLDKFRMMGRIDKAFDKANKSNELILEEQDYKFLKDSIEKDIPSTWGKNPNILKSIEEFLEAQSEIKG